MVNLNKRLASRRAILKRELARARAAERRVSENRELIELQEAIATEMLRREFMALTATGVSVNGRGGLIDRYPMTIHEIKIVLATEPTAATLAAIEAPPRRLLNAMRQRARVQRPRAKRRPASPLPDATLSRNPDRSA